MSGNEGCDRIPHRNDRKLAMGKNRLEMFSDGVIAIIITIMVLELSLIHISEPTRPY